MSTTAYDLALKSDLDQLEAIAAVIVADVYPPSVSSALASNIYEALVEALRHVEVNE